MSLVLTLISRRTFFLFIRLLRT